MSQTCQENEHKMWQDSAQQFGVACTLKICCVFISLSDPTAKKRLKKTKPNSVELEMIKEIQNDMRRSSPAVRLLMAVGVSSCCVDFDFVEKRIEFRDPPIHRPPRFDCSGIL